MYLKNKVSAIIATLFAVLFMAGINVAVAQSGNIVDVINSSEDHTIFAELLAETELDNIIAQQGPFTVVAPTNEAFEALGADLDQLRENPDQLQNIVIGHLFQGEVEAAEVEPALGIAIEEGDISASNGLVHISDEVIMGQ
ncbi:MAG: fasciclin domain-containing protein [Balneolaceae bacterium]|nr:MAG: fasciclin domain-containing protein [Balneolaceae bacterium]